MTDDQEAAGRQASVDQEALASALRGLMDAKHISIRKLAKDSGVGHDTIRRMRNPEETRRFDPATIIAVSAKLEPPPGTLFGLYFGHQPINSGTLAQVDLIVQSFMTALAPYLAHISDIPHLRADVETLKARIGDVAHDLSGVNNRIEAILDGPYTPPESQ